MSIKLAKDEKIVKDYAYATIKTKGGAGKSETTKNLIVTNKRVVHRQVYHQFGAESITNEQVALSDIKSVDVSYGKQGHPIFLIWAILFSLVTIGMFPLLGALKGVAGLVIVAIPLILAAVMYICYALIKRYVLICTFGYNVTANMVAGSISTDIITSRKSKKATKIKISVNSSVAKDMAEELGAVILDAAAEAYVEA